MSPRALLPPTMGRIDADMDERISRLERRIRPRVSITQSPPVEAMVTVASVGSSPADLVAGAMFKCDGDADQVEINEALALGAIVFLLPGTYHCDGTIELAAGSTLQGGGRGGDGGTVIDYSGADWAIENNGWNGCTVADLQLLSSGGGIYEMGGAQLRVADCDIYVSGGFHAGIEVDGEYAVIERCYLDIDASNEAILLWGGSYNTVVDNKVRGGGIVLDGANETHILGNHVAMDQIPITTHLAAGVAADGAALALANVTDCVVADNIFGSSVAHVVVLYNADVNLLHGNYLIYGDVGSNGIHIHGASSSNSVQLNRLLTNTATYGIHIAAGCLNNLVTNNDLLNGYATDPINDLGTGTVTTPGNRPGGIDDIIAAIPAEHYLHVQGSPAASWVITHNLGWEPGVTVVDSAGDEVLGNVHHDSVNQLTLSFSGAMAGRATLS